MTATIGFIGLGNMGAPMAINLHRAGYQLQAYDLDPQALDKLSATGIACAASASAAARGAQVIISMLPASQQVRALYLGEFGQPGLLQKMAPGSLIIDCSTIAAATSQQVGQAAAAAGIDFVDAPVSGGTNGADAGTLTFMVGASQSALARARPYLLGMGQDLLHAGPIGAGQTAKICNNMLLAIVMLGTSEAISLGLANGLDPRVLSEIMRRSSGGNWALEHYNPYPGVQDDAPASRGYSGGFATDLMLKDLGLALESALARGSSTPLGGLARALYAAHSLAGHGRADFSSIMTSLLAPSASSETVATARPPAPGHSR